MNNRNFVIIGIALLVLVVGTLSFNRYQSYKEYKQAQAEWQNVEVELNKWADELEEGQDEVENN